MGSLGAIAPSHHKSMQLALTRLKNDCTT